VDSDFDRKAILESFVAESEEGLAAMESCLLRLEKTPGDVDALGQVFRTVHTLKGNAAMLDCDHIAALAHRLEDMLDRARGGALRLDSDRISLLLRAVDVLREQMARVAAGGADFSPEQEALLRQLGADVGRSTEPEAGAGEGLGGEARAALQAVRSLRVDVARLDQLLRLTGEIAVARARQAQLIDSPDVSRRSLHEAHRESERLYLDLQDLVMRLRMVPVGPTFEQLQRTVRDLARDLGKQAVLKIEGHEVEVDNTVLQLLRDPLVHLVRNSLDHGIETPEERRDLGKDPRGLIRLSARHETGGILIELRDDGAGLRRDRVLERARQRGLVAIDQELPDASLFQLVFEPGFSTAERISDVSGRGVGLDVVRRNIHALRGSVAIAGEAGRGTTITIRLPLTLAIIEGLLVRIGGDTYVVPLELVQESLALPPGEARRGLARGVVSLRGQTLPYVRLRHLFRMASEPTLREILLVIEGERERAGLVVDGVVGQSPIVIKPLAKLFDGVRGVSASAVLASGRVALILDVQALVAAEADRTAEATAAAM
jgi:two-component system, chemotaxis family, sensor kinase CheA